MRTEQEVEDFYQQMRERFPEDQANYYVSCFEGCIPRSFWNVEGQHVQHNTEAFEAIVLKYCSRWKKARKNGYGLLFVGDNGTGKTMFLSFVLTQMIKRGASVYFTSLAQFGVDITKGFKDKEAERRLQHMLESDFVAIDELGKEHKKSEDDSYIRSRLELMLKTRYDGGDPTLCASNLDPDALEKIYGSSCASMWEGKYELVMLEAGDFRKNVTSKMKKEMGFG